MLDKNFTQQVRYYIVNGMKLTNFLWVKYSYKRNIVKDLYEIILQNT